MGKKDLNEYYGSRLEKYGSNDARSCGYANNEAHEMRSNYALELVSENFTHSRLGVHYLLDFGVGPNYRMYRDIDLMNNLIFSEYNEVYKQQSRFLYTGVESSERVRDFLLEETDLLVDGLSVSDNMLVDSLDRIDRGMRFDVIICNGVLQDCSCLDDISYHIKELAKFLEKEGVLVVISPSNEAGATDLGETYVSPYDLVEISRSIDLPYKLEYGKLGKHLSLVIKNTDIR